MVAEMRAEETGLGEGLRRGRPAGEGWEETQPQLTLTRTRMASPAMALLAAAGSARMQWQLEAAAAAFEAATQPVGIRLSTCRGSMYLPLAAVRTTEELLRHAMSAAGVRRGHVHHYGPRAAHGPLPSFSLHDAGGPLQLFPGRRFLCVACEDTGLHHHVEVFVQMELDTSVRAAVQVLLQLRNDPSKDTERLCRRMSVCRKELPCKQWEMHSKKSCARFLLTLTHPTNKDNGLEPA